METDETVKSTESVTTSTTAPVKLNQINVLPDVDLYIHLLVVLFALDTKKHKQVIIENRVSITIWSNYYIFRH